MERFQIARDPLWRAPLMLIGADAERSHVTFATDALDVQLGMARVRVPYANVREAKRRTWPWYLGIGIRIAGDKTLGLVGSTKGVVQLSFREPTVDGVLFMRRPNHLAVSLEDPEGFLAELQKRLPR
jgi:hypothetical protein